jgi:hypothetical protein
VVKPSGNTPNFAISTRLLKTEAKTLSVQSERNLKSSKSHKALSNPSNSMVIYQTQIASKEQFQQEKDEEILSVVDQATETSQ